VDDPDLPEVQKAVAELKLEFRRHKPTIAKIKQWAKPLRVLGPIHNASYFAPIDLPPGYHVVRGLRRPDVQWLHDQSKSAESWGVLAAACPLRFTLMREESVRGITARQPGSVNRCKDASAGALRAIRSQRTR
jgi:hypothetical protein